MHKLYVIKCILTISRSVDYRRMISAILAVKGQFVSKYHQAVVWYIYGTIILCVNFASTKRTVVYILNTLHNCMCQSDNISSILLPFSEHLNKGRPLTSLNQRIRYRLQSTKKVPFTINRTLQQSHEDRFHVTAGTCHLKEEVSTSCSICGITSWKDINHMPTKVSVITRNKVYPGLDVLNNYCVALEHLINLFS